MSMFFVAFGFINCSVLYFSTFSIFQLYFINISVSGYLVHVIVTFKENMALHHANSLIE